MKTKKKPAPKAPAKKISQGRINQVLLYNHLTGDFLWRKYTGMPRPNKAGTDATTSHHMGYRRIFIDGQHYLAHRIAWIYTHGSAPDVIDHINQKRDDNRLINLRASNLQSNLKNAGVSKNNTSGYTGVVWSSRLDKWIAQIWANGSNIVLGRYTRKRDAVARRARANKEYGFDDLHGAAPSFNSSMEVVACPHRNH